MKASIKLGTAFLVSVAAIACQPSPASAQAVLPLEPAPLPQPVMPLQPMPGQFRFAPPLLPPTTQYSFNGPSAGTVTFIGQRTTFYQPGPAGGHFSSATVITPVFGYVPGYYRDYYTPLFYRP